MTALLALTASSMLLSAIFWFVNAVFSFGEEDSITSISRFLLVAVLILSSITIMVGYTNVTTKKCDCGTKIESSWEYCAKCGREISE